MKGDFSRDTFEARKNFSRVLMQQGRVQLDADWNEQSAILLHYIRTLAADIIGPHGGPDPDFGITFVSNPKDLTIASGRYYVNGILCENRGSLDGNPVSYRNQPSYTVGEDAKFPAFPFLAYLDVWERHITCLEDDDLCEPALDGVDTTSRTQVIWQVKLMKEGITTGTTRAQAEELLEETRNSNARLTARSELSGSSTDPCVVEPDARYRGAENQLYRVEVHTASKNENGGPATFKWSRENGTVIFPIMSIQTDADSTEVTLTNLGRDDRSTLGEGDWVELIDDDLTLQNRADTLLKVSSIDRDENRVSLEGKTKIPISDDRGKHPLLRRWDQKPKPESSPERSLTLSAADNAALVVESESENDWLTLEDGIQIRFVKPESGPSDYRTGDYWLIPARVVTGSIIWPRHSDGKSLPKAPRGIEHHYAPLALVINAGANGVKDRRRKLEPMTGA